MTNGTLFDIATPEPALVAGVECELYSERLYRVVSRAGRAILEPDELARSNEHLRSAWLRWRPVESKTYTVRR